jgi:hypothetical protein
MTETRIDVASGKYTVVLRDDGTSTALRYGEPWPAFAGQNQLGNLTTALARDLQEAREKLAAFDWVAGLYDDKSLTRDDVANELHDYRVMIDNVPKVYDEVTGGVLSKPTYPADTVISYFNDHVQKAVEDDRKDTFGPLLDAVRRVVSRKPNPETGRRTILEVDLRALEAEIEAHDGLASRYVAVETGGDDAPAWTAEDFATAQISRGGEVIRETTGALSNGGAQ